MTHDDIKKGMKFGKLTVLAYQGHGRWQCRCECGTFVIKPRRLVDHAIAKGSMASCRECSEPGKRDWML